MISLGAFWRSFNRQKTRTVTRSLGTRILRFSRNEAYKNSSKIIQKFTIRQVVAVAPSPLPEYATVCSYTQFWQYGNELFVTYICWTSRKRSVLWRWRDELLRRSGPRRTSLSRMSRSHRSDNLLLSTAIRICDITCPMEIFPAEIIPSRKFENWHQVVFLTLTNPRLSHEAGDLFGNMLVNVFSN